MVLDSSALVAIIKQEPGYERLESKIDAAEAVLIGAPTLLETLIVLARQAGVDHRIALEAYLRRVDARIVDFTEEHANVAGGAYMRYGRGFNAQAKLNYGDCISYAVAALAGDQLLFVGEDFTHTDITAA
jgi:ribonuclease VapC